MTKLKDLFWRADGEPTRAAPKAPAAETPPTAPTAPTDAATGDAKVDQVLVAFEAMKAAMPAPQLAVAIAATAKAIGVAKETVADTLTRRLAAFDTALADRQRELADRQRARHADLEVATAKVQAEIAAMEERTAALRQQLAAATAKVGDQATREQTEALATEQRTRAEAARLIALRDFLSTSTARSS